MFQIKVYVKKYLAISSYYHVVNSNIFNHDLPFLLSQHNTFQLVVATDDTTSYALFLYESLEYYETMSNMKLQYAIAAVGSGGGLLNKITNVSSVSGTIGVKNLPNMSGNVMISANPGTNHKGFFVLDISSAMSK